MKKITIWTVTAVWLIFTASCDSQSGDLQFKTVEVEDFVKHPKGTEADHGLRYKFSFTYPSGYADKAVLKSLQQQFVQTLYSNSEDKQDDFTALPPEKALTAVVEIWKAKYKEEIKEEVKDPKPEWVTGWDINYSNTILFMNENLLQLKTENQQYLGGAHGSTFFSCHLFNLQTGKEYSRDDIFKPEAAGRIHRMLVAALLKFWDEKSPSGVFLSEENVWSENTDFAVTPEGIDFVYSHYDIVSYAQGCAVVTLPYDKIFPYLREGTPVWNVAKEKYSQEPEMDDMDFSLLVRDIYYKLPASFMPDYLKSAAQRREVEESTDFTLEDNVADYIRFEGDGVYKKWNMGAYLTEDRRNIVLIVQHGIGLDGYSLQSDKTLNFHIDSERFTEIERPVDPFTADELIDEKLFATPELAAQAKAYFNEKQRLHYFEINKEGYRVWVEFFEFWIDREDVFDYYNFNHVIVSRKWNGKRFVKGDRTYLHDE